jgi:hypothetical protein
MERRTQDLPTWFLVFVCPTRVLFERRFVKHLGFYFIFLLWLVPFFCVPSRLDTPSITTLSISSEDCNLGVV